MTIHMPDLQWYFSNLNLIKNIVFLIISLLLLLKSRKVVWFWLVSFDFCLILIGVDFCLVWIGLVWTGLDWFWFCLIWFNFDLGFGLILVWFGFGFVLIDFGLGVFDFGFVWLGCNFNLVWFGFNFDLKWNGFILVWNFLPDIF